MQTNSDIPPAQNKIAVAIIDDQQLVRAGIAMVINSQPDMQVSFEAADGEQAIRRLASFPSDVILMDIRMPNLDGLQATKYIMDNLQKFAKPVHIIVLTTFDLDEYAMQAICAGASGFLIKNADPEELLHAIRAVYEGDAVLAPSTTKRMVEKLVTLMPQETPIDAQIFTNLTAREKDVVKLMARGCSNNEIAAALFVSQTTVKTHVARIFDKLGVRDRLQAVILAYESGFIRPAS